MGSSFGEQFRQDAFLVQRGMQSSVIIPIASRRERSFAGIVLRASVLIVLVACCGCCQYCQHPAPIKDFFHCVIWGDSGVCTQCGDPDCDGCCGDGYAEMGDGGLVHEEPGGVDYYDTPYYGSPNGSSPHGGSRNYNLPIGPRAPDVKSGRETLPPAERIPTQGGIVPDDFFSNRGASRPGKPLPSGRGEDPSREPSAPGPLAKDKDDEVYPLQPVVVESPLQQLNPLTRLKPSNDRDWRPEFRKLAHCDFHDDGSVELQNVRNCRWLTDTDCVVAHYDREYDLADLKTVDFIVVPFNGMKQIAHTMLSFGFGRGDYVGVSIEIRQRRGGDNYSTTKGFVNEYELVYVVADEHDLIPVRVLQRNSQVYIYRSTAPPDKVRKLFVEMMERTNRLAERPEFYNTLTNNCTTNIAQHINHLAPGRIPYDYRILLPGYSANLAYDLGLIENRLPFEEVRQRALANERVVKNLNAPDFSARIRR